MFFSNTYEKLLLAFFQGGNAKEAKHSADLRERLTIVEEAAKKITEADKQEDAESNR